jgi:hypothetical protein
LKRDSSPVRAPTLVISRPPRGKENEPGEAQT